MMKQRNPDRPSLEWIGTNTPNLRCICQYCRHFNFFLFRTSRQGRTKQCFDNSFSECMGIISYGPEFTPRLQNPSYRRLTRTIYYYYIWNIPKFFSSWHPICDRWLLIRILTSYLTLFSFTVLHTYIYFWNRRIN